MKNLILLIAVLFVGCATTPEQKLRDSVVGEYEDRNILGTTYTEVFLENGVHMRFVRARGENGKKYEGTKWSISNREIHVEERDGSIRVYRIIKDKSITCFAEIKDGKRRDFLKGTESTWKKIK